MSSPQSNSPPSPTSTSVSATSFVYPVRSLLANIQPAANDAHDDVHRPTVSISTTSSSKLSRRSQSVTSTSSTYISNRRRSSKSSLSSSSKLLDGNHKNFRHFPGEDHPDFSSSKFERHTLGGHSTPNFITSSQAHSSTTSSLSSPSPSQYDDSGDSFSISPCDSPAFDPRHPPAFHTVAQEAFMACSDPLLPQNSWSFGLPEMQETLAEKPADPSSPPKGTPSPNKSIPILAEIPEDTAAAAAGPPTTPPPLGREDSDNASLPWNPSELGLVHLPPLPASPSVSGSSQGGSSRSESRYSDFGSSSAPISRRSRALGGSLLGSSGLSSYVASQVGSSSSGFGSGSDSGPGSCQDFGSVLDERRVPSSGTSLSAGDASRGSSSLNSSAEAVSSDVPLVTVRFKHVQDDDGHHVVTGREGKLSRCEDEPIRTPGAVQGYGVLIVVEELEDTLIVRQVSENSTTILGLSPAYLFSLECFTDTLPISQAAVLWDTVQFLVEPEPSINAPGPFVHPNAGLTAKMNKSPFEQSSPVEQEDFSPHVFLLSGWGAPGSASIPAGFAAAASNTTYVGYNPATPAFGTTGLEPPDPTRKAWTCWCAIHRPPPSPYPINNTSSGAMDQAAGGTSQPREKNLIIMEFELERDTLNPLYPPPGSFLMSTGQPGSTGSMTSDESSGTDSSNRSATTHSGSGTDDTEATSVSVPSTSETEFCANDGVTPTVGPTAGILPGKHMAGDTLGPLKPHTPNMGQVAPSSTASTAVDLPALGIDGEDDWAPSPEDIMESTTSHSKPLLALERLRRLTRGGPASPGGSTHGARKRFAQRQSMPNTSAHGANPSPFGSYTSGVGMMDIFAVISQMNEQLGAAPDLDTFLKVVVGLIKDLTQFHRVLAYQFDEMCNGQVVAELADWSRTHVLYRGLHFPKGDIPQQARELYLINKVRLLYDRTQPTARIVVRSQEDLEIPLNMTHCYLRAMSPIHIKYLGNMGVRASMSISIMAFGALWGLVACHSYGPHGMRVSFPVRQILRLLSQSISRNIERLSYAQRLRTRKLINTISSEDRPTGYIVSNASDLLGLFDADFGILVIGEGAKILGPNQHGQEILIIAEYLRLKQFNTIQVSQAVTSDFADLQLSTGLEVIAGLLYVPLSSGGKDFIALLRKGQPRNVRWAGMPSKHGASDASVLEPRTSFKVWSEILAGRCRVWTDEQLETAGVLALVYGKFIEVWRQRETALQATKLTNILLSNARHEVRTPLNHIINCLEMALNGPLDFETRDNLTRSHTASKNLLFTINDLLDLTRLESGNETTFNEPFDLATTIQESLRSYRSEAKRRGIEFHVDVSGCPSFVVGDSKKIRTVVQNLAANALKYTSSGSIKVACTHFDEPEGLRGPKQTAVEIVVADTGRGISSDRLESIFREFEQVESAEPKTSSEPGVGLGLAVVARIVEQLGGQLRVESQVDQGSRFSFLIPLALDPDSLEGVLSTRSSANSSRGGSSHDPSIRSGGDIESLVKALSSNHMESGRSSRSLPTCTDNILPPVAQTAYSGLGVFDVVDSRTPLRPVKIDQYEFDAPHHTMSSEPTHPQTSQSPPTSGVPPSSIKTPDSPAQLRVLIVEDDDINRAILAKRLRLDGHIVIHTTNGQEGFDKIKSDRQFDCILMDINMPILNGIESTQKIRQHEQVPDADPGAALDRLSYQLNGRIPIFAVSASLLEKQRHELMDCGMDGWILKPIDHKRLRMLLQGVTDLEQRERDFYRPGCNWEHGGWFSDTVGVVPPSPICVC